MRRGSATYLDLPVTFFLRTPIWWIFVEETFHIVCDVWGAKLPRYPQLKLLYLFDQLISLTSMFAHPLLGPFRTIRETSWWEKLSLSKVQSISWFVSRPEVSGWEWDMISFGCFQVDALRSIFNEIDIDSSQEVSFQVRIPGHIKNQDLCRLDFSKHLSMFNVDSWSQGKCCHPDVTLCSWNCLFATKTNKSFHCLCMS